MESNDDLIRRRLNALKRARVIETGASERFKLDEEIKEMEAMLSSQPSSSSSTARPALQEVAPTVDPVPETIPAELPSKKRKVPWWAISLGAAIVAILISWWMIASLKIAVIIGLVVFVLLLLRDPERIYLRLGLLSMGLVVTLNAINISGMLKGKIGDNEFQLQLTEPSIFVSLFLIIFAGYMMYLHSKRE